MPDVFLHRHTVGQDEIDQQGHASNLAYVAWMQAAALAHSAAQGWPAGRYLQTGYGWVVRRHAIEYRKPAGAGEVILVETWVATMDRASSLRRYRICRAGDRALLATAETKWALIDYATGRPRRIPRELAEAFPVIAGEPPCG